MPFAADRKSAFSSSEDAWIPETEGQLSVDVLETEDEIVIRSAVAGAKAEDLDIQVTQDTITIRGRRDHGCVMRENQVAHVQECYWGAFSRSIVLPCHVHPEEADAVFQNGILTVTLKKAQMPSRIPVISLEE